jgi:hypothetical protein
MQMQMASGEQGGVGASGGGCCSCFLSLVVLRGETARKNLPKKNGGGLVERSGKLGRDGRG